MTFGGVRSAPLAFAGLLAAAGGAWWVTAERMAGMDAGPGTGLGTLGWFTGAWAVMMAAMMLPSLAPTAAAYATLSRHRTPRPWLLFTAGYMLVWTAAGVLAYGLFTLGKSWFGAPLAWHAGGRPLAAGVLSLAALYELTPPKRACLARCGDALQRGTLRSAQQRSVGFACGVRNGGWCIGCSWALMAALFALGVMSLGWMALIAGLVAIQKLSPTPTAARAVTAGVLVVLALGLLVAPGLVPGLVVPGRHSAMHAMRMS
jgi:predicted metal-binding membrane protein